MYLFLYNLELIWSVLRFLAAYWFCVPFVYGELVSQDHSFCTFLIKTISICIHYRGQLLLISSGTLLFKFIWLFSSLLCYSSLNVIKFVQLPSSQFFGSIYCLPIQPKIKHSLVYVICIIWGDVSVLEFFFLDLQG